jgi:hypothetical protein
VAVVARDRATGELAFAKIDDAAPSVDKVMALPAGLDDPELVGSARAFGMLARVADAGDGRVLLRFPSQGDAGFPERVPIGAAACATEDGVYAVDREKTGWSGSFISLDAAMIEPSRMVLSGNSAATIVCGQRRAFVALSAPGELSAVAWARAEHDDRPTALPKATTADAEEDTMMAAMDDALVVVKLDRSVVHTLVWTGAKGAAWRKADPIAKQGLALEMVEAEKGKIGLLFVRTVPRAKGCPGEATDAVAEVALVDAETGKLARAPESLETWRCGAEPGPFFSGWAAGRLVVAWPRGADAACTRAGVRRGGLGFAVVDPATGRAVVGRLARPAETIVPAGCDATRCYAVALTRGSDPCGPSDGPESGRLEVIAYP